LSCTVLSGTDEVFDRSALGAKENDEWQELIPITNYFNITTKK
jgi:hypothetical protein